VPGEGRIAVADPPTGDAGTIVLEGRVRRVTGDESDVVEVDLSARSAGAVVKEVNTRRLNPRGGRPGRFDAVPESVAACRVEGRQARQRGPAAIARTVEVDEDANPGAGTCRS